jgi:hypothetical protein
VEWGNLPETVFPAVGLYSACGGMTCHARFNLPLPA